MPLVTGSSGQIGSFVVDRLEQLRDEGDPLGAGPIRGLDLEDSRWTTHVGDVRERADVVEAIEGCRVVVHCAAQVSVDRSLADPPEDASHNVLGTTQVLEAARRADPPVERVVHFSSAATYGDPIEVPIPESHPQDPRSPYGLSKRVSEAYALHYADARDLPVTVLRPFNVYSDRQDPGNSYAGVITAFARRLGKGEPPEVHGDGEQSRDFVHAEDVVQAVERVCRADADDVVGEAFNVGTGIETTINTLADTMIDLAGQRGMEPEHGEAREGDVRRSVADISRIQELGYRPRVPLGEGLGRIVAGH
jgi:UDP-glucose 4-epimerase